MTDTSTTVLSRIARTLLLRDAPAAAAHVASLVAVATTLIMVGTGTVEESNPISGLLHATVGVETWAMLTPVGVAVAIEAARALPWARLRRATPWAIAAVVSLDALGNLAVIAIIGLPETLAVGSVVATIGLAGVVAGGAYWHRELVAGVRAAPRPSWKTTRAVGLAIIMITAIPAGVAFVGTQDYSEIGGFEGSTASAAEGDEVWNTSLGGDVRPSPTIVDGTVYVGSWGGSIYALDEQTGEVEWEYATGDTVLSSPTVADGTVYIGSSDNSVYALDKDTGEVEWEYATGGGVESSPTVADGTVYIGSNDNSVYALDKDSGTVEWEHATGSMVYSSPTIADGTVYVGSNDNSVYALDKDSGTVEWEHATGDAVYSSPTVANGTVFVGSYDSSVYALNKDTGDVEWESTAVTDRVRTAPTVANGTVFVGSYDNSVYALDEGSGAVEWERATGGGVTSSPTVANGTVYVGSNDGTVYALNNETGDSAWEFTPGNSVYSSPTVADGTVYVGAQTGELYALDTGHSKSSVGTRVQLGTLGHVGDISSSGGGTQIQVTDQNGEPISDATVEIYRANEDEIQNQLGDQIDSAEEEAERLLDEASNPTPDEFDPDLDPTADGAIYDDPETTYPTTHTEADMGIAGWTDSPSLSTPRVSYESGETVYAYAWDPSAGATSGLTDDGVVSSQYGDIDDDATFRFTQLDAFGDGVQSREVETSGTYNVGGLGGEYDYAQANLPDGYYRVEVVGSDAPGYVIEVGDAAGVIEDNLRTEADRYAAQAEQVRDYRSSGIFERQRGATNATGVAQDVTVPDGKIVVQAYKGPDVSRLDGASSPAEVTMEDLRNAREAGYNGSIYLSTETRVIDTRDLDEGETIEVEMQRMSTNPYSSFDQAEAIRQAVEDYLRNGTERLSGVDLSGTPETVLLETRNSLVEMIRGNDQLEARYCEEYPENCMNGAINFEDNPDPTQGIANQIETMRWVIDDAPSTIDTGDGDYDWTDSPEEITTNLQLPTAVDSLDDLDLVIEFEEADPVTLSDDVLTLSEDGTTVTVEGFEPGDRTVTGWSVETTDGSDQVNWNGTQYLNGEHDIGGLLNSPGVDEDAIAVEVVWSDGSTTILDDSHYTVNSGAVGADTITINDYPVPEDREVGQVNIRAATGDGVVKISDQIQHPSFNGAALELDSVALSTMTPGPDERVTARPTVAMDTDYELTNATVTGPDGQSVNATVANGRVSFDTVAAGRHRVQMQFSDGSETMVKTIAVNARDQGLETPPAVHETSDFGSYAVANGLEGAAVEREAAGTRKRMMALIQAGGDPPNEVHFHPESEQANEVLRLQVRQGEQEESVRAHTNVRIHTELSDDALVFRKGSGPITADGATRYGDIDRSGNGSAVIRTYTNDRGTVDIRVVNDPSLGDRVSHRVQLLNPFDGVPFIGVIVPSDQPLPGPTAAIAITDFEPMLDDYSPIEMHDVAPATTAATVGVAA